VHADRYQRARLAPGHPRQSHAHRRHAHPLAHGRQPHAPDALILS